MAALKEIKAATLRVAKAETSLEELAAMVALEKLVTSHTRALYAAAFRTHTPIEVARAIGISRQATAARRRQIPAA